MTGNDVFVCAEWRVPVGERLHNSPSLFALDTT